MSQLHWLFFFFFGLFVVVSTINKGQKRYKHASDAKVVDVVAKADEEVEQTQHLMVERKGKTRIISKLKTAKIDGVSNSFLKSVSASIGVRRRGGAFLF